MNVEGLVRDHIFDVSEVDDFDVAEIAFANDVDRDELADAFDRVRITISFEEKK